MERHQIKEKIMETIQTALAVQFTDQINFEYSLLDQRIGFEPRDLVVLFFELEKAFDIQFEEKDILTGRFDLIDGMIDAIAEKLASKEARTA